MSCTGTRLRWRCSDRNKPQRVVDRLQLGGLAVAHAVGVGSDGDRIQAAAVRIAILEQQVVGEREESAAQRGIDRQLVVGPLDGAERHAQRVDLLALVEAAAADEQVRHLP